MSIKKIIETWRLLNRAFYLRCHKLTKVSVSIAQWCCHHFAFSYIDIDFRLCILRPWRHITVLNKSFIIIILRGKRGTEIGMNNKIDWNVLFYCTCNGQCIKQNIKFLILFHNLCISSSSIIRNIPFHCIISIVKHSYVHYIYNWRI